MCYNEYNKGKEVKTMRKDFIEIFKDDYKKIGKYSVRPFSVVWWIIFIMQGVMGAGAMYMFYCTFWIAFF